MVRMTNVGLLPGDRLARGDDRRDRRRDPDGHEPLVVDRRQAPELPVRLRDRLGDQGRQAGAAAEEPDLHRRSARGSGARWTCSAAATNGSSGGRRTAARASRCRSATPGIRRCRPGSAASGWACAGERRDDPHGRSTTAERRSSSPTASSRWSGPAPRDAEVEVTVRRGTAALTRFATSFIHQNVADGGEPRRCSGSPSTGGTPRRPLDGPADDETLGRLIDGVLEAARVRPPDPDWPGLAAQPPAPDVDHWDDATAEADARRAGELGSPAFVDAAGGLETAGLLLDDAVHVAFANSAGQRARPAARPSAEIDGDRPDADRGRERRAEPPSRLADLDGRGGRRARGAEGARRVGPDRPRARAATRSSSSRTASPTSLAFLLDLRVQRQGRRGGPVVRRGRRGRSSTRRSRCATTSTDPATIGLAVRHRGHADGGASTSSATASTTALLHTRRTARRRTGVESTGHARRGRRRLGRARRPTSSLAARRLGRRDAI